MLLLTLKLFEILDLALNQLDVGQSTTLHLFVPVVSQKSIDVGDVPLPGLDSRELHNPLNLVEAHLDAAIRRLQVFSVLRRDLVELFDREVVRADASLEQIDAGLVRCVLVLAHQLLVEGLRLVEVTFEHWLLDETTTKVCSEDE